MQSLGFFLPLPFEKSDEGVTVCNPAICLLLMLCLLEFALCAHPVTSHCLSDSVPVVLLSKTPVCCDESVPPFRFGK